MLLLLTHAYITVSHTTQGDGGAQKGERNKLRTCLPRPVALCKLLTLSLLMSSPPRIERRICPRTDRGGWAWCMTHVPARPHAQHVIPPLIFTPVRCWCAPILHWFCSPSTLGCIRARRKESNRWKHLCILFGASSHTDNKSSSICPNAGPAALDR